MTKSRVINSRARGKHVGHACEGHLRGILHHVARRTNCTIARSLPFEFPVECDAVLLDPDGRVRAIFIVAYWENSRNSDSKFYRTRTEYAEAWRSKEEHDAAFADTLQVFTVLYGTRDGWKAQVLQDLHDQCPPLLFLPDIIAANSLSSLVASAFSEYASRWETGRSDAREIVEQQVATRELRVSERKLADTILKLLEGNATPHQRQPELRSVQSVRLPAASIQTRYRQALSVLSVFGAGEVEAWLAKRRIMDALTETFARRAFFLGMGTFAVTKSITGRVTVQFRLREPIAKDGSYEAHRPDFVGWLRLAPDELTWILQSHRDRTRQPSSVFHGGALDQAIGNVDAIAAELSVRGTKLVRAMRAADNVKATDLLMQANSVSAIPGHQACNSGRFVPVWGAVASAIAMADNNRALRGALECRRQETGSTTESVSLVRRFSKSDAALQLFVELVTFCTAFRAAQLEDLSQLKLPRLLALDEPCSLMADFYNTLTTNPSHNPLNEIVRRWLSLRYPGSSWNGWPARRGANPGVNLGQQGRRQWAFVAQHGNTIVCAEAKSITANNWGNKSKELFDRVAELRTICSAAGLTCLTLLMFDGDLSTDNLRELSSGIAHDEIWSVDEVLNEIRVLESEGRE